MTKTSVYKFYDDEQNLLYVGISLNVFARLSQHKRDKDWWDEITNIKVQHTDTREDALDLEARLIKDEEPKYNIAMNNGIYIEVDKEAQLRKLAEEIQDPSMSDEFKIRYKELKEKIMHLALEKIAGNKIPMKYNFFKEYEESFDNPEDVLLLASELANMDYQIEQAKKIAETKYNEYLSEVNDEDE